MYKKTNNASVSMPSVCWLFQFILWINTAANLSLNIHNNKLKMTAVWQMAT